MCDFEHYAKNIVFFSPGVGSSAQTERRASDIPRVRLFTGCRPPHHFRGHVGRGAGRCLLRFVCDGRLADAFFGRRPAQDEIANQVLIVLVQTMSMCILAQNIGGFDVCVYYTITMQIGETSEHVLQNPANRVLL